MNKPYYNVCPNCGAHLDPSERCDCMNNTKGESMNQEDVARKAREAANAYKRAWNKRNPEKNKEYQRRYWAKKAKEMDLSRHETAGKDVLTNGIDDKAD